MFAKKIYIVLALVVALGSIFTWFFLYSNYPHQAPLRAKQVFYMNNN